MHGLKMNDCIQYVCINIFDCAMSLLFIDNMEEYKEFLKRLSRIDGYNVSIEYKPIEDLEDDIADMIKDKRTNRLERRCVFDLNEHLSDPTLAGGNNYFDSEYNRYNSINKRIYHWTNLLAKLRIKFIFDNIS